MMPTLRFGAGEPPASMVKQLNEWRPEVLVAYPSVLRLLADEQLSGRLNIAPRVCATSAEVLTLETRKRVHDAWTVRVWETYGATEYAPIAAECEAGNRHLFEDGAIIENVDASGRPVPAGELGERVLLTIFSRRTQPLIRYEISDMLRLSDEPCPCGRPFRCLAEIEGRQEDVLSFPSQTVGGAVIPIHPNLFHELLESVPATGWQVVHDGTGLTVNLTGLRDETAPARIQTGIERMLDKEGAVIPSIRVAPVDELRRGRTGKAPLVLQDRH
jgi:phenylacetate-coenzyme A ligase PaaK-like adenylate-forming protein